MSVTIIKKQVEQSTLVTDFEEEQEDLVVGLSDDVDVAADLSYKMAELNGQVKELGKKYKKAIGPLLENLLELESPAQDESFTTDTHMNVVEVSAESTVRTVDGNKQVFALLEKLQSGLAFDLMHFNLSDMDKYLTPKQLEKLVSKDYSGRRAIKFYPKEK